MLTTTSRSTAAALVFSSLAIVGPLANAAPLPGATIAPPPSPTLAKPLAPTASPTFTAKPNLLPTPGPLSTIVNLAPPGTRGSGDPEMASDGNDVYVLLGSTSDWGPTTKRPITVTRSTDGGRTYLAPVTVASPEHFSTRHGRVAARGNVVVATWASLNVLYYAMSSDRGATFGAPVRVDDVSAGGGANRPEHEIAFSAGAPVVVWEKAVAGTPRVFFARLGPTAISSRVQLGREPYPTSKPKIGADGTRIVVAYAEDQNPIYTLNIAQSSDGGTTWDRLATPAEGDGGFPLTDAERAHLRLPTTGSSKTIWKLYAPGIENVFVFGATTIVTLPVQGSTPQYRAIIAAAPATGLFRGRAASLDRCADSESFGPTPLAPRGTPAFTSGERTPWLFASTPAGIESIWAQGHTSTAEFRSKVYRGRFTGAARLTDCRLVAEETDLRPVVLQPSGDGAILVAKARTDHAFGLISAAGVAAPLRRAGAGIAYSSAMVTPRTIAFTWLDAVATNATGAPKGFAVTR